MTEVTSWAQTPAGLLANRGLVVEPPFAERAREILSDERRQLHAEFEARMDAADPLWRNTRAVQEALAARGWPGQWITIDRPLIPPELEPLYARKQMDQAVQAVYAPAEGGRGMRPANAAAEAIDAATAQKLAQARARLDALNAHRPGGAPYRITESVAEASGGDDGW